MHICVRFYLKKGGLRLFNLVPNDDVCLSLVNIYQTDIRDKDK